MNSPDKSTFHIKTLGCKVNQYESQIIREGLIRIGYTETEKDAANYIINSCTVTRCADNKTRNIIRHFHKLRPEANIFVTGCCVETKEDREALSEIPVAMTLVKNRDKQNIPEIVSKSEIQRTVQKISGFKDHDRAFVKVQDGCDHNCSYCKIPIARGRSVSRPIKEVIDEITGLLANGFKEIVITGICLGAWGADLPEKKDLITLLQEIDGIQGEFRIRISSVEPLYVTQKLIDLIAGSKKVCRHLHIPLQSGDNGILKKMNRPYDRHRYFGIVKNIRKKMPDAAITTDVMVGFPQETAKSFKNTYRFMKKIRPSRMHIFTYSPRKGTRAFAFPGTPEPAIVEKRYKKLSSLAKALSARYAASFNGKTVRVLIEKRREKNTGLLAGYTDTYVKVLVKGSDALIGNLINLKNIPPQVITACN